MKRPTHLLSLLASLVLLLTACIQTGKKQAGMPNLNGKIITVAVENAYAPFNMLDPATGKGIGWDYDAMAEICKRLNCAPRFKQIAWEDIFPALQNGKYDILANGVSIMPERDEIVDFSIPYLVVGQAVLVRADNPAGTTDLQADTTALIGTQIHTINEMAARQSFSPAQVVSYQEFDVAIRALLDKSIAAVVLDSVAANSYLAQYPGKLNIAGTIPPESKLAFAFPPGSELKAQVDIALQSMIDDGALDELNKKWGLTP